MGYGRGEIGDKLQPGGLIVTQKQGGPRQQPDRRRHVAACERAPAC
jgi:hypothetical protein